MIQNQLLKFQTSHPNNFVDEDYYIKLYNYSQMDPLCDEEKILKPLISHLGLNSQFIKICSILINKLDHEGESKYCWEKLVEYIQKIEPEYRESLFEDRKYWWPEFHFHNHSSNQDYGIYVYIIANLMIPSRISEFNWSALKLRDHNNLLLDFNIII